ncbi:hypothetical protein CapIbe_001882 [Capra ibex]
MCAKQPRGGVEDTVRGAGLHDQLYSQGKCSTERTGLCAEQMRGALGSVVQSAGREETGGGETRAEGDE